MVTTYLYSKVGNKMLYVISFRISFSISCRFWITDERCSLEVLITVSYRNYLLQLRCMDCRFFVREAQVARFDEGVLPSALSIFHDDSSFRSGQFIKWYIYILFSCYWGNIVITVFIICLMAGRNRLVSRMALPTIAGQSSLLRSPEIKSCICFAK